MNMTRGALWPVVAIFVAASPVLAPAQSSYPTMPVAGASATAGMLGPWEIMAAVRRAGFDPISRPVQRGHVFLLRAVDQDDADVRLTVDAGTGRVLWIGGVAAMPYGGPDYYGGYRPWSGYARPPMPPANIPNTGPGRTSFAPAKNTASIQHSPPLPRTRPANLASGAKQPAPVAQSEPKAAAPSQSNALPATPTASPAQPTMVPVAPLE